MSAWTDKKIEKLKVLWDKGVPTAEIGKKLGFSKNAIVGKVHRLGLSNRNSPIKTASVKSKKEVVKKTPASKVSKPESLDKTSVNNKDSVLKKEIKEKEIIIKNESPKTTTTTSKSKKNEDVGVSIYELSSDRCCWPIDDPNSDDFRFCGKKVFKNKPYCLEHCALAYTTSTSSEEKEQEQDTAENTN